MDYTFYFHFLYLMCINAIETCAYFMLFAGKLKRRRLFALRIALYLVAMFILCDLVCILMYYIWAEVMLYDTGGTMVAVTLVMDFVVFGASIGGMFLFFDEKPTTLTYAAIVGKCAMNISSGLYNIIVLATEIKSAYTAVIDGSTAMSWILYFIIHLVCLAVTLVVFALQIGTYKQSMGKDLSGYILAVFIVVLAALIIFEGCIPLYGGQDNSVRYLFYSMAIIFSLTILLIEFFIFSWINKVKERNMAELQFANYKKQSETTKKSIETINIKCHDLKHQIGGMLSGTGIDPGFVQELQSAISIYDTNIDTGNEDLNILLMEKSAYCDVHHITMSVMMDGKALCFMSVGDLHSFFGNAIDNATEYLLKVDEKDRFVRLSSMQRGNMLTVRIENYYEDPPLVLDKKGFPITSKPDKENHGFGVRSIKAVAEKYGGVLTFKTEDGMFVITAGFPLL